MNNTENNSEKQCNNSINKIQQNIIEELLLNSDTVKYNNTLLIKFDSWIDLTRLKEAIADTVKYYSFLNTRIQKNKNGQYYFKKINTEINFTVRDIEEINLDAKDIDEIKDFLVKPFDIFNDRLFRIKIIHAKGHYIFVEMHQLISDEASLHIFLENVSQTYLGNEINKEELNCYDFCSENSNEDNILVNSRKYFSEYFEGRNADCNFIGDINNSVQKSADSAELVSRRAIADMIKSFCKNNDLTVNGFFTAAFGFLLSEYNAGNNSLFEAIQAGRNNIKLKNTIFNLAKQFPVVCEFKTGKSQIKILDYIKTIDNHISEVQSESLNALDNVRKEKGINSDVLFYYRGENFNFYSFCGKIAKPVNINSSEINQSLKFTVSIHGAEICFDADYDSGLYSKEFIEFLLDSYDVVISEFLLKSELSEVETTSYKTVKMINSFKAGGNTDAEILDAHGKLIPPGAFGYLNSTKKIARWLFSGVID